MKHISDDIIPLGPDNRGSIDKSALLDGSIAEVSPGNKKLSCQEKPFECAVSIYSTVVVSKDLVFADLGKEVAIFDPRNGLYYSLDDVGRIVWNLLHQPTNTLQIWGALSKEYDVPPQCCARDMLAFLQELVDAKLVDIMD